MEVTVLEEVLITTMIKYCGSTLNFCQRVVEELQLGQHLP
jgi:hypothetical protein